LGGSEKKKTTEKGGKTEKKGGAKWGKKKGGCGALTEREGRERISDKQKLVREKILGGNRKIAKEVSGEKLSDRI